MKQTYLSLKIHLFTYAFVALSIIGCAQEPKSTNSLTNCPIEGNAVSDRIKQLNILKNRVSFPSAKDFDNTITLEKLLAPGNDTKRWSDKKAVSIVGYVYDVKVGGIETCNCKTKDKNLRDTHIELVTNPMNPAKSVRFIAEVTPRWREIMKKKGVNWSTSTLRDKYLGRWVKIEGWLFFDDEHDQQSQNTRPDGKKNWRGTAWEVHPITNIELTNRPR
jgi:hypothetical protein